MRKIGNIIADSVGHYIRIAGAQHAAAFGFYACLSLLPLFVLVVSISSRFVDSAWVSERILRHLPEYFPLDDKRLEEIDLAVQDSLDVAIDPHGGVEVVAFFILFWSALKFFRSLVHGMNLAWECRHRRWWRGPLKNFVLLGVFVSAMLLGIVAPVVIREVAKYFELEAFWISLALNSIPLLVLFYGLTIFYSYTPERKVYFRHIWLPTLLAAGSLQVLRIILSRILYGFLEGNIVYETFGLLMAFLIVIFLSGMIILYFGCLGVAIEQNDPKRLLYR